MSEPTVTLTEEQHGALWDAIADVRDRYARTSDDVGTDSIIDALLPWLAARLAEQREQIAAAIEEGRDQFRRTTGTDANDLLCRVYDDAARIARAGGGSDD